MTASPVVLLLEAAGPPREAAGKAARLAHALAGYTRARELDRRLERLRARGRIEKIPTRLQLAVGGFDKLRFFITPAAQDYYVSEGIDFTFHQVLRFLDEPASLADPVGLFSERDGIIGHLMQVVHANPVYDLQLLDIFEDGHDQLEHQLEQMLRGDHPRARSIRAIVEDPEYHERLLEFVRRWRKNPSTSPMLRENVEKSARLRALDALFGNMTTAFRYFCWLPNTLRGARRHIREVNDPLTL